MKIKNNPQAHEKLAYIDSLRGIAILMVILVHTARSVFKLTHFENEFASLGQLGVQLFFVVSAITLSISADFRQNEANENKKFIIRRFFRIAPLYYFAIIWYFLYLSGMLSFKTGIIQVAPDYTLSNILANFFFIHAFFPPANNNIVPGGWSIGTEMAFYLCFPWLFLIIKKIIANRNSLQIVFLFAIGISLWYFLEYLYVTWAGVDVLKNSFIYYNLLNQFPVFLLGIMAYFLSKDPKVNKIPVFVHILLSGIFAYITVSLWRYRSPSFDPFMFIPATVSIAFVFLYFIFKKIKVINFEFLQRIGRVSYSMYIWHFMFVWYGVKITDPWFQFIGLKGWVVLVTYYLFGVLFSFLTAILSEKFIEKPGIHLGKFLISKLSAN